MKLIDLFNAINWQPYLRKYIFHWNIYGCYILLHIRNNSYCRSGLLCSLSCRLWLVILGLVVSFWEAHNNGLELTSPLAKQYNRATRRPYHLRANRFSSHEEKNHNKQLCVFCSRYYLEWAECEVDKVPGVTTAALHAFIDQHGEHDFVDPQ